MELIFFGLIWLIAGFVNGLSGMGAALVAVPLLSLFLDMQIIIPLACILVTLVCALLAWHFREHCDLKSVLPFIYSSLPGAIIGAYTLKYLPTIYLQVGMSLFLVSYVAWSLSYNQADVSPKENKFLALTCGFASGLTGAAISFAGPPLAIYIIYIGWSAQKSLVTLGLSLVFISLITCITQAFAGLYTKELIPYVLIGAPAISAGLFLSFPLVKYITRKTFNRLLLVIIGVSGILAGIKAIIQLSF